MLFDLTEVRLQCLHHRDLPVADGLRQLGRRAEDDLIHWSPPSPPVRSRKLVLRVAPVDELLQRAELPGVTASNNQVSRADLGKGIQVAGHILRLDEGGVGKN